MVLTHLLCGVCHRLSSTVSTLPPVWFTHSVPLSLRRALSHGGLFLPQLCLRGRISLCSLPDDGGDLALPWKRGTSFRIYRPAQSLNLQALPHKQMQEGVASSYPIFPVHAETQAYPSCH